MTASLTEQFPNAAREFPRVVLIAASADGIQATSQIIRALPCDFPLRWSSFSTDRHFGRPC